LRARPGLVCRFGVWTAGLAQKPGLCGLGLLAYVVNARARPGPKWISRTTRRSYESGGALTSETNNEGFKAEKGFSSKTQFSSLKKPSFTREMKFQQYWISLWKIILGGKNYANFIFFATGAPQRDGSSQLFLHLHNILSHMEPITYYIQPYIHRVVCK
jgi:hypothetical protein